MRGDQHDLAVAGLGARPAAQQQADLLVTADQAGQSRTTQRVGETPNLAARLQARVGIATGLVVVGDLIGEGSAQEQSVPRTGSRRCWCAAPARLAPVRRAP